MQRKQLITLAFGSVLAILGSNAAFADHNSIWGAGFANMPNDIHNTRIDTSLTDDDETFIDFVQYGAGADTVNRYLTTTTSSTDKVGTTSSDSATSSR